MDALIENGDNAEDSKGENVMIEGFEEIIQQVLIRIKIPKGKFIYDRDLGSECGSLDTDNCKSLDKCLETLMNESVVSMGDTYVEVISAQKTAGGIKAEIKINCGANSAVREVVL